MEIKKIDKEFSVCQVEDYSLVDMGAEYCFIGKTDEEKYQAALEILKAAGYEITE